MQKNNHKGNTSFHRFNNYNLMGGYIKRFNPLYIMLLFVVAFFEAVLFVREMLLPHKVETAHFGYVICYIVLFIASASSALFLIFQRKKKENEKKIAAVMHIYAFIALLWGTVVSLIDYQSGNIFPAVFFTILATIGGLLVLNPFIYLPVMTAFNVVMLISMYFINPKNLTNGNIINIIVLFVMIAVISYRTTAVAVSEEDQKNKITLMSLTDSLTGLKNENAYYRYLDKLEKRSEKEEIHYAVIVMDTNGLKFIDDTYGHRFGAHVISTAGKLLPTVFKNSEIFHTGGDEFVCVVEKEFENLELFLEEFSKKLEYQKITFEGQELILSLARGVAIHENGEKYNDTYQRADRDMYKNKPIIKAKYNIVGR